MARIHFKIQNFSIIFSQLIININFWFYFHFKDYFMKKIYFFLNFQFQASKIHLKIKLLNNNKNSLFSKLST